MADVAALLGKAKTTIRDACKAAGHVIVTMSCATDAALVVLKQQGLIKANAAAIALVRLSAVISMAKAMGAAEVLQSALAHVKDTSNGPPPQRHTVFSALAGVPAPAVDKYATYVFPTDLPLHPPLHLGEDRGYALQNPSSLVRTEIEQYKAWSQQPINLERSDRYLAGVKSTTLEKVPQKLLGYMGYISNKYALRAADIGLHLYDNPSYCAEFISYLIVRDVKLGHLRWV